MIGAAIGVLATAAAKATAKNKNKTTTTKAQTDTSAYKNPSFGSKTYDDEKQVALPGGGSVNYSQQRADSKNGTAWVPGVGETPITIVNGKTQETNLPVGTIINTAGGKYQITGANAGGYTSVPYSGDYEFKGGSSGGGGGNSYDYKQMPSNINQKYSLPELNLPEYKPFNYQDFNYGKEFSYDDFSYEDFNYDANNDPSYKQYADMYARQGQSASEAALANASAATGGMASSFAAAANAQAQQAYAKKTADMIPVLEGQAYDRYSNDRNFSYQDYLNDRSLEYDKFYNDKNFSYQDYLNDRNLAYTDHQNKYGYDRDNAQASYNADWQNINYTDSRNDLAYDRQYQQAVFDYEKFLNEQNRGDKLAQNEIDNKYRQDAFDWNVSTDERDYKYGAGQDAIRNSISWANHNLSQQSENRQKEQFEYNKTQDELSRAAEKEAEGKAYNQYLREKIAANEEAKRQQQSEETIKLAVADALKAADSGAWLRDNGAYLSTAEYDVVVKRLKDLQALTPKQ